MAFNYLLGNKLALPNNLSAGNPCTIGISKVLRSNGHCLVKLGLRIPKMRVLLSSKPLLSSALLKIIWVGYGGLELQEFFPGKFQFFGGWNCQAFFRAFFWTFRVLGGF